MNQKPFNPEMLILARESKGWSQTELAGAVAVQQGTISKIEGGLLAPSSDLVNIFSNELEYPEHFFYESDRVYGFNSSVFFHRKRQSIGEKVLRRLHAQMNLSRMRVRKLTLSLEIKPQFRFPTMEPAEYPGGVTAIARLVRQMWMLPLGPIRNLVQVIENAGGIVIDFDFGTKQADAISEWVDGHRPIFLMNTNADIPWDRRRLTLAHELGHVIMHTHEPNPNMEDEANEFAAEFLMPRTEIKPSLYQLTLAKLTDLKRTWKVSMQALIERAYQLKTITEYQRKLFYINLNKNGRSRLHEPLENEYAPERPELVRDMVRRHMTDLEYSTKEIATILFFGKEQSFEDEIMGSERLRLVVA
jgi:Zn-dependent peptidase ImmA (M78 family)/transcriptional regulator with XRE-family HTH domain